MSAKSKKGKSFPKKPVDFGTFLVEYRESEDGMLRFLKERIDNLDDAHKAIEKLLQEGAYEPTIRKIG